MAPAPERQGDEMGAGNVVDVERKTKRERPSVVEMSQEAEDGVRVRICMTGPVGPIMRRMEAVLEALKASDAAPVRTVGRATAGTGTRGEAGASQSPSRAVKSFDPEPDGGVLDGPVMVDEDPVAVEAERVRGMKAWLASGGVEQGGGAVPTRAFGDGWVAAGVAYNEGNMAGLAGTPRHGNPYLECAELKEAWDRGHIEANLELEARQ